MKGRWVVISGCVVKLLIFIPGSVFFVSVPRRVQGASVRFKNLMPTLWIRRGRVRTAWLIASPGIITERRDNFPKRKGCWSSETKCTFYPWSKKYGPL